MSKISFRALRGRMGGEVYYVAMIPIRQVISLFDPYMRAKGKQTREKEAINLKRDAQRRLNLKRVPEIADYIIDSVRGLSPYGYVFSSLTANSVGNLSFHPTEKNSHAGELIIDSEVFFSVADGQHRLAGISEALGRLGQSGELDEGVLAGETISVLIFDVRSKKTGKQDIARAQQIFTDLNRNAKVVGGSVLVGMGNTASEKIARRLVSDLPGLEGLIEEERNTPSKNSPHLFSLLTIKQTVDIIIGRRDRKADGDANYRKVHAVWQIMMAVMPVWRDVMSGKRDPRTIKKDYVCCHAVVVRSLAAICEKVLTLPRAHRGEIEASLRALRWTKANKFFHGKILNEEGAIINNKTSQALLISSLEHKLGLGEKRV